jgi:hypothetical protein
MDLATCEPLAHQPLGQRCAASPHGAVKVATCVQQQRWPGPDVAARQRLSSPECRGRQVPARNVQVLVCQ